jgi:hypothetical protein
MPSSSSLELMWGVVAPGVTHRHKGQPPVIGDTGRRWQKWRDSCRAVVWQNTRVKQRPKTKVKTMIWYNQQPPRPSHAHEWPR